MAPPSRLISGALNASKDLVTGVFNANKLVARNQALEKQIRNWSTYESTITELRQEVDQYRGLLDLPTALGSTRISADIIGYVPSENRMVVGAGSSQGVAPGQPAVCADGLVGVVQSVSSKFATIALVTSPKPFTVGAIVATRNPPSAGLLHGEGLSSLMLEFDDPNAPVSIGDLVTTSGFSEHIPRGVVIGKVVQVIDDAEFGRRQAKVFPAVTPGNLRAVVILK